MRHGRTIALAAVLSACGAPPAPSPSVAGSPPVASSPPIAASPPAPATGSTTAAGSAGSTATPNPCTGVTVPSLGPPPAMPLDFFGNSQIGADCMAWQEFLYLNWPVDPANPGVPDPKAPTSSFGKPGDTGQTVWESYLTPEDVFNPSSGALAWKSPRPAAKSLSRLSMLGDGEVDLGAIQQAGTDGWLTDQSGNLVYYEVHINQDEYDFITTNTLTTFAGQAACGANPGSNGNGGFNLPAGGGSTGRNLDYNCSGVATKYGLNQGAIEIKAAWRVLPADGSLNYRYKIANAQLHLPDGTTQKATIGLIGLHIIHKTPGAAQFVWATFEQIDNDPDAGSPPTPPVLPPNAPPTQVAYTLYNPGCNAATDTVYNCKTNTTLVASPPPATPLPPCQTGSYTPGQCYPYWAPMQITRVVSVQQEANSVTGYAWSLLPAGSVFNYYRLIDAQWPSTPTQIPPQTMIPPPLSGGGIRPANTDHIVANTTLETFLQSPPPTGASCMDCHQYTTIGVPKQQSFGQVRNRKVRHVSVVRASPGRAKASGDQDATYASDYSFIFSTDTKH